ncbi:MAG: hypothetical protein JWL77_5506 [Chthonomonadaceae bacterium]|nr:hypothetical protein [Chthonomonadaceae bacterium]
MRKPGSQRAFACLFAGTGPTCLRMGPHLSVQRGREASPHVLGKISLEFPALHGIAFLSSVSNRLRRRCLARVSRVLSTL